MLCLKNLDVLSTGDTSGGSYFEKAQGMFTGNQVSSTHLENQHCAILYFYPQKRTKCLLQG